MEATRPDSWLKTIALSPPSLADNVADVDRLRRALQQAFAVDHVTIPLALQQQMPRLLHEAQYQVSCACFARADGGAQLVGLQSASSPQPLVGVAVDLGTTRVVLRLVELGGHQTLAETTMDNPQGTVAPDVLARVHHTDQPGGAAELRELIRKGINQAVAALCRQASLPIQQVSLLAVAGNTTMAHLLLGLDPHWLIREPYIPAANHFDLLLAEELGLEARAGAAVYLFPNIGSYFGGDLLAGILFAGLHRATAPSLLVDVGTNAEVVIGSQDWLLACAGAAGPALEGGAASMGMTAGPGVIDRVTLANHDDQGPQLEVHTIDDEAPRGICGSGLIDLAACLFRSGCVDLRGELVPDVCGQRYRAPDGIGAFVLVPAEQSGTGQDLCISQPELDSLIRSKAAMFTIVETLTGAVGLGPTDLQHFHVGGTFGSFIDPESAITIGMLPDLPRETFRRLGNSSLGGATMVLTQPENVREIAAIREAITYLELNVNQDFMNRFSAAKFLPHTDPSRFPSVRLSSKG
jgi:uncharacterized 2Fe-2S/4Fe-4S cluster protein (DUF4445 family)